MNDLRETIGKIDSAILRSLAKRERVVRDIAKKKLNNGVAIRDSKREQELLSGIKREAKALGLSPSFAESIFRLIVEHSVECQENPVGRRSKRQGAKDDYPDAVRRRKRAR